MLDVLNISKSYGQIDALQDVSLQIGGGEIVGLLGPNGAGKTTLMKIITGYLHPDAGVVHVNGVDVVERPREAQAHIGYLPETAPLYPELSVQAYLKLMAELRGVQPAEQIPLISQAVYDTNLQDHLTRPIGQLSKGFRQRVGLAQAILHRPRLLILDEPTMGLDPTQIVEVRSLIRRLATRSTVLFSTHILSEVEALCDRVIILMNGRVKADARLSELASASGVVLVLSEPVADGDRALGALDGVEETTMTRSADGHAVYHIHGHSGGDGAQLCTVVYQLAHRMNWPVRELRPDARTLEMVFNDLAMAS